MKWISAVAMSALLAIPVFAQSQAQGQADQQKPKDQPKAVGTAGVMTATINDIVDNPNNWYGKQVVVSGPIGDLFSQRVFNIEEQGVVDVDDELLVVLTQKTASPKTALTEEKKVQVRGEVRSFVKAEIERTYGIADWGWYGVEPNFWVDYERKPVLVATQIDVWEGEER